MTTINVLSIAILKQENGMDIIILHLDLPDGAWPYTDNASADIKVAKDTGEEYVKKHFPGITPKVIEDVKSNYKFAKWTEKPC